MMKLDPDVVDKLEATVESPTSVVLKLDPVTVEKETVRVLMLDPCDVDRFEATVERPVVVVAKLEPDVVDKLDATVESPI